VRGNRERDLRTGFAIPPDIRVASMGRGGVTPKEVFDMVTPSLTWRDLERISSEAGLPLLVKGILTSEDAILSVEHGAAGVVVSNHGGRQLDGVSATIDALPEVVEAVAGRIEVLVDGGIRRGTDVVKALALGARAVLAGRAPLWGLTVDGEPGARRVLELLRTEILTALQLVGATSPGDVTRTHVQRVGL
jgi:isopentenyl diphosphate isomerase/L-lactate dehydrogenase-like FMN-dependent dehydrogenase